MAILGLLAGALLALLVALLLARPVKSRRARPRHKSHEIARDPRRVSRLCAALNGEAEHDRPLQNQILTLGADVAPAVIEALATARKSMDEPSAARIARIEELLADFGLAVIGPLTQALAQTSPTTGLAASLLQVVGELGEPGLRAFLGRGVDQPELAPFLPLACRTEGRLPRTPTGLASDPARPILAVLLKLPASKRAVALTRFAGLLAAHPPLLADLLGAWDEAGRVVLFEFLKRWLPLANPALVDQGLQDSAAPVRALAAELCGLLHAQTMAPSLVQLLTDEAPSCRAAAIRALGALGLPDPQAALAAGQDGDPAVRLQAAVALLVASSPELPEVARFEAPACYLAVDSDIESLLKGLDAAESLTRHACIWALSGHIQRDPRARERLILLAEELSPDRAIALRALVVGGEPTAPELLAQALKWPSADEDWLAFAESAQELGPMGPGGLTRRLRSDPPERLPRLLSVLRACAYGPVAPALLRHLGDERDPELAAALSATLFAGGAAVQAALEDALDNRGLLNPLLCHLGSYPDAIAPERLLAQFDQNPALQASLLGTLELMGERGRSALEAALAARAPSADPEATALLTRRLALLERRAALHRKTKEC